MSALGDYVHYSAINYLKYGTSFNDVGAARLQYDYKAQKNHIMKKLEHSKSYDLTGLEDSLNMFFDKKDNSKDNSQEIKAAIEKLMEEQFGQALGKINWDTLDMEAQRKRATTVKTKLLKEINENGRQRNVKLNTILKRIQTIQKAMDEITDINTKQELNKKVNEIYTLLNQVVTDGKKTGQIGQLRKQVASLRDNPGKGNLKITPGSYEENLVTTINQVLKDYVQAPAINLQKGTLFEYLIAAIPLMGTAMAEEEITKSIEKAVVGGDRQNVVIDLKDFGTNLDYSQLNFSGYAIHPNQQTAVSFGTSQGKIDVELNWNGQIIPVSAKNVKLKSKGTQIHILSGASLLSLLQDENVGFVNHFLNVIAEQKDKHVLSADVKAAREAMKYTLLYKAATGDTFGRKKAEVFIVNDNTKKGGIKVIDMHTLLSKAFTDLNAYAAVTVNDKSFNTFTIKNDFVVNGTYKDRLTNFVNQLHAAKIGAALKANVFK